MNLVIASMLILATLVAVMVFAQAVAGAPDGGESDEGFAVQPGLQRQVPTAEAVLLNADRDPLSGITTVTTARI